MKIDVIGGGPAGLYAAILLKRAEPARAVTLHERGREDDASGLGVVLPPVALETLAQHDTESHRVIAAHAVTWDRVEIHRKGDVRGFAGNPFSAISRAALLHVLQQRAREVGVTLNYEAEISGAESLAGNADLVIAADGANSTMRSRYAATFAPDINFRPNKYCWLSSSCPLDAFTFGFRETPQGIFIAHAYPYEAGRSAWVIEMDAEAFRRAGLAGLSDGDALRFLSGVFAEDLAGHALDGNVDWRNFPVVRCAHWSEGNVVLIGDARATVHFSVGSGTRLALEDAAALRDALAANASIPAALADYEARRRYEIERMQQAGDLSAAWFETISRHWHDDADGFAAGLMSRARAAAAFTRYPPRARAAPHP